MRDDQEGDLNFGGVRNGKKDLKKVSCGNLEAKKKLHQTSRGLHRLFTMFFLRVCVCPP